jgi:hypothetical protein
MADPNPHVAASTPITSTVGITAVFACVYALDHKQTPPDGLITLFTTSLAALAGLFAKTPT